MALPHCLPGCAHVHFSNLKHTAQSPLHYKAARDTGIDDTPALRIGRVFHEIVLEEKAAPSYIVWDRDRRGKEWETFRDHHSKPGFDILTTKEFSAANFMADAVRHNEMAMRLLKGQHEIDMDWTYLGRACRGTIDALGSENDVPYITELKSTYIAQPSRFGHIARNLGYFAQLPWYANGARLSGLIKAEAPYPDLRIVAVEPKAPYAVTTFFLHSTAIEYGEKCYRLWMEQVLNCEASNEWPGYGDGPHMLDMPEELDLRAGGEAIWGAE